VGWTFTNCVELAKNGCANDSKMIFIATPFILTVSGIIRLLVSKGLNFNLVYRIHDFICAFLIIIPLFINNAVGSMNIGIFLSLITIVFILVETIYSLLKRTSYCKTKLNQ